MACHTPDIYDYKTVDEQKKFLRKRARLALKEYTRDVELMKQAGVSARDSFVQSDEYKKSEVVLAFMPMSDELDLLPLCKRALEDGKRLAFPRMIPDSNDMDFYFVNDFDKFSNDNKYGINEPSPDDLVEIEKLPENTVVFVPGLVFNLEGSRLGRGKGFYDKFLERLEEVDNRKSFVICGVCFVICITKAIPMEKNDKPVDYILNEYGFVKAFRNGGKFRKQL